MKNNLTYKNGVWKDAFREHYFALIFGLMLSAIIVIVSLPVFWFYAVFGIYDTTATVVSMILCNYTLFLILIGKNKIKAGW